MSNNNVISIDLAKDVFQVCLMNEHNKPVINKKVRRSKLIPTVQKLDATRIVMEACYSSNHWGRTFEELGFTVDLIPPHQVKPYVTGNKNDHNDAIAIAEASKRPRVTLVKVKSKEQQDIQSLYRIRERLVRTRTTVAAQLRGLLAEYGVVVRKEIQTLRRETPYILEDAENGLTVTARSFIRSLYDELLELDTRIDACMKTVKALLKEREEYTQLQTVPGVGEIVAGHMIAAVADPKLFKNGRSFAAWIGLTPKQEASGNQSKMLGISKRGNASLRRHFIHGARAVLRWSEGKDDPLNRWVQDLLSRKSANKVVVALANKLARIAWSVMKTHRPYSAEALSQ